MYEYHGWITLRKDSTSEAYEGLDKIVAQIEPKINSIGSDNGMLDLRYVNGEYMIHLFGFRNHKEPRGTEIADFYRFVAKKANGSYGLLYERDDESQDGNDNEFVVHKLVRGEFTIEKDSFLSPFVGVVEDIEY